MAIRKRYASLENSQARDELGKFTKLEMPEVELQSKSGKVSWSKESGNTYIREEKEKFDVNTLFLYASILLIIVFK